MQKMARQLNVGFFSSESTLLNYLLIVLFHTMTNDE
jgi:hypothetical protein